MKRLLWWTLIALITISAATLAYAQHYPRFHRYAMTRLDASTSIDIVKDTATKRCYAVYLRRESDGPYAQASRGIGVGAATLGEVPCDPIPVPPTVGAAPPASVVR